MKVELVLRVLSVLAVPAIVLAGCSKGHCGKCAKDSDCSSGLACDLRAGACKALGEIQGQALVCPADCTASEACGHEGRCTFKNGACVIGGESDCRSSPACVNEGRCQLRGGECVPTSDDDCRKSSWCKGMGLCKLRRENFGGGVPADFGNKCVAGSDQDCKDSNACSEKRLCFKNGDWCAKDSDRPPTPAPPKPARKPGDPPCNPDFDDCPR